MSVTTRPTKETTVTLTMGVASLASDTNRLAGRESTSWVNSGPDFDFAISGKVRVGSSPTAGKIIQLWPIAKGALGTPTFPDVFDGTDSNETVTSLNVLLSICPRGPIWQATIDSTSSRDYFINNVPLLRYFDFVPTECGLFLAHDTGVALDSTAGNHEFSVTDVFATST